MAHELEDLVVDARLLANTAKESESKLDAMLRRATLISGKLTCTREYQRDVEKLLVSGGKLDRRRGLLDELQKENRMIQSYEEENSMLRDQLEKSYATLDEMVSRHRRIMQRVQSDQSFAHLTPMMIQQICDSSFNCDVANKNDQIEQAQRLMDVMRYCEQVAQKDTEMFARVVRENRSLRELLNNASISDPNIVAHFRKSMQEYEKEQKSRLSSRRWLEEREEEEEEETSVLFNRTDLSEGSILNTTVRKGKGGVQNGEGEMSAKLDEILGGIDELSEESDAETVLERDEEGGSMQDLSIDEDNSIAPSHNASARKDNDADSGTASSLSSSPVSSSSSDGDGTEINGH